MNIQKYLLIGMAIFLIMPMVGCTKGLDSEKTAAKAYTATANIQSCRIKETSSIGDDISEMEFAAPDRIYAKTIGKNWWIESIRVGTVAYIRDSQYSKTWQAGPTELVSQPPGLQYLDSLVNLKKLLVRNF